MPHLLKGSAEPPTAVGLFLKGNTRTTSDAVAWGPGGVRLEPEPSVSSAVRWPPLGEGRNEGEEGSRERERGVTWETVSLLQRGVCSKGKWE